MNFKELLYNKKVKQKDLAKLLLIQPSRVSLFVNGIIKVPWKHFPQLEKLLGISTEELRQVLKETLHGS